MEKQIKKKIKKRRWVFIYEVAKYYRGKYKVLNKQTLINKVVELWFSIFDEVRNKDSVRKDIDKMAKEGILIKRREEEKDVLIIPSLWVEVANEYKAFADDVKKKIQEIDKKKNESIEVRRMHTERIREEIIKEWIHLTKNVSLWDVIRGDSFHYRQEIAKLKDNPLFEDLKENHLPSSLGKNPFNLQRDIENLLSDFDSFSGELYRELKERLRLLGISKDDNFLWNIEGLTNALMIQKDLRYVKIHKIINIHKEMEDVIEWGAFIIGYGKNVNIEDVKKRIVEISNNQYISKIREEFNKNFLINQARLDNIKKELIKTLTILEKYPILPGECQYTLLE